MAAALAGLRELQYEQATLWSFDANARANAFYETHGFERDGATPRQQHWGSILGCATGATCRSLRRVRIENLKRVESFITLDGSEIREVAGPVSGNAFNQSLAEATVPPGGETVEHFHRASEEIYFFTHGAGRMRLGDEEREVGPGDTVVIAPGVRHKLSSTGPGPLRLLCCCSPPYSDADTVIT